MNINLNSSFAFDHSTASAVWDFTLPSGFTVDPTGNHAPKSRGLLLAFWENQPAKAVATPASLLSAVCAPCCPSEKYEHTEAKQKASGQFSLTACAKFDMAGWLPVQRMLPRYKISFASLSCLSLLQQVVGQTLGQTKDVSEDTYPTEYKNPNCMQQA